MKRFLRLIFRIRAFRVRVFRVRAFRIRVFRIWVFGIWVFGILSLSACFVGPSSRRGYQLYQGGKDECGFALEPYKGMALKWDVSKLPISFYIHESVPPKAHRSLISNVHHWNSVWIEYGEDRGVNVSPLFDIINENKIFSGRPGKDGYNMIFFISEGFTETFANKKSTIQAVTVNFDDDAGRIVDTDIIFNGNIEYFYDRSYDSNILAMLEETGAKRRLSSTESPGLWAFLKRRFFRFFQYFLGFFKKRETLQRNVAAQKPKVPKGYVDFPSLGIHEFGHSPGLAHVEDGAAGGVRGLASRSERDRSSKGGAAQSVMRKNLFSGTYRRRIRDYDLKNLFCGYYGNKKEAELE